MRMRMRRPSAAMVVALMALVLGAGGAVTAGVLITGVDIKDNTIRSADIHDETITSRDVDNGALTGVDVANNSLSGADVNESSLGEVPNANRLDGLDSTQLVRKGESFTRHFSCDGTAWENGLSWKDYTFGGGGKIGTGAFPPTLFICSVHIPDGARVSAVSFSVTDTNATQDNQCSMWRTDLTAVIGNTGPPMAYDVTTSGTPGNVRITDTTIDFPVIDNSRFSYFLSCFVGNDADTGLSGATVAYSVTGR
jgi:hypothetical protein